MIFIRRGQVSTDVRVTFFVRSRVRYIVESSQNKNHKIKTTEYKRDIPAVLFQVLFIH
jgi:hypothetical protein